MTTVQHIRPIYNLSIYGWLLWDYVHSNFHFMQFLVLIVCI